MMGETIPEATIETVARTLYKEARRYGFRQADYLRLVNSLLDISLQDTGKTPQFRKGAGIDQPSAPVRMPLEGEGVRIRKFTAPDDKVLLVKWLEDQNGRYFLLSRITGATMALDRVIASDENILGVITLDDWTPIGLMAFLDYDRWQRKAEIRKLIGEVAYRGRGFAKKATQLWIRYGLYGLGLKKIYLNTLETQVRNIRLNEELGFTVEGILRKECYFDGEYHDILRMALLNEQEDPSTEAR